MSVETAKQIALDKFRERFNCAESVLMGLVEACSLECPCGPRIATAFGGGMSGCGHVCGALTGAMMALGLRYGRDAAEDTDAKAATYGKVRELFAAFKERFGSIQCFDLIGIDLTTPEGAAKANELDLHGNVCPDFVAFAAQEAARLLECEKM